MNVFWAQKLKSKTQEITITKIGQKSDRSENALARHKISSPQPHRNKNFEVQSDVGKITSGNDYSNVLNDSKLFQSVYGNDGMKTTKRHSQPQNFGLLPPKSDGYASAADIRRHSTQQLTQRIVKRNSNGGAKTLENNLVLKAQLPITVSRG